MSHNIVDIMNTGINLVAAAAAAPITEQTTLSTGHCHDTVFNQFNNSNIPIANCLRNILAANFHRQLSDASSLFVESEIIARWRTVLAGRRLAPSFQLQNEAGNLFTVQRRRLDTETLLNAGSRSDRVVNCQNTSSTPPPGDATMAVTRAAPWRPFDEDERSNGASEDVDRVENEKKVNKSALCRSFGSICGANDDAFRRQIVSDEHQDGKESGQQQQGRSKATNQERKNEQPRIIQRQQQQHKPLAAHEKCTKQSTKQRASSLYENTGDQNLHLVRLQFYQQLHALQLVTESNNASPVSYRQNGQGHRHASSSTDTPTYAPIWRRSLSSTDVSPASSSSSPTFDNYQLLAIERSPLRLSPNHLETPTSSHSSYNGLSIIRSPLMFGTTTTAAASASKTTEAAPLTCSYCDKVYTTAGALKMHVRTHTLPCRCSHCGKAFSRMWLLRGHLRTHTGERPFLCPDPVCGRAFADRSNLRAHLRTHNSDSGSSCRTAAAAAADKPKRYGCTVCGKTFSRLSLLVRHEMTSCRCRPSAL